MKESLLKDRLSLMEKELGTLAEKISEIRGAEKAIDEIRAEIKGLKLFLSRVHPEFKKEFLEIMKKIKS